MSNTDNNYKYCLVAINDGIHTREGVETGLRNLSIPWDRFDWPSDLVSVYRVLITNLDKLQPVPQSTDKILQSSGVAYGFQNYSSAMLFLASKVRPENQVWTPGA